MTNSDSTGIDKKVREEIQDQIKKENKKSNFHLIFGANASPEFLEGEKPELIGGELGLQYGPLALVGSYGVAEDFQTKDIQREMSQGRIFYSEEFRTDAVKKGLGLETHLFSNRIISPFVGVGVNQFDYNLEGLEKLNNSNGDLIKSNSYEDKFSEKNYFLNGGVDFKIGEKSKLGVNVKYDLGKEDFENKNFEKGKFYGGVRFTRKIGKR
jgi:hypothetical protein